MTTEPMLILVDGNNLAWAGYHALRRSMNPETPAEKVRTALLGLTQATLGLVVRGGLPPASGAPAAIARRNAGNVSGLFVAFDEGRPLLSRGIWPAYQTSRESDPQFAQNEVHIVEAIRQFSEMAKMLPIDVARGINTEADDLLAHRALSWPGAVRISSSDRDFMQLVSDRVSIYSPIKRVVIDLENFDEHAAPKSASGERVVFPRERYLDYRAASGDTSDDLPGLPGLGTLGAARILQMYTLDEVLAEPVYAARALGRQNAKLSSVLRSGQGAEIVARNRILMDLRLAAARYESIDEMTVPGSFDEAGFRHWLGEQRLAGLDTEAAVIAMSAFAG